jgi:hypothetical protein
MYATIRRYTPSDPSAFKSGLEDLKRRLEQKFLPMLQDVKGFHSYYVVNAEDRELVTISMFDDRSSAQESTRRAAEFVRSDPLRNLLTDPDIVEGELMLSKEAAVGAH